MRVAVIQPSYAPWLGYMSMMANADLFIYYDDVQYDKNGWRNRNRVLVNGTPKWLTLAIDKASLGRSLQERSLGRVMLASSDEFLEHRRLLSIYYKACDYVSILDRLYPDDLNGERRLVDSVIMHTEGIAQVLGIKSDRVRSSALRLPCKVFSSGEAVTPTERKNARLLGILKNVGCTEYISGPAARSYLNQELFLDHGISVTWNPFKGDELNLSVLHYLLDHGPSTVLGLISM